MPDWEEEITRRLRSLRLEPAREAEIVEEVSQHLEDRYEELLAGGATDEEARRLALGELSDEDLLATGLRRVEQEIRAGTIVPGGAGNTFFASSWQDLHYGLRMLRKNPGFTLVAVVTLALGIGGNTAIFSVVNAILLRPLPFPQPHSIVQLLKQYKDGTGDDISVPLFNYWRERNEVFSHLAAFSLGPIGFNLATRGLPERVPGARVSAEFFQVLGVRPTLGREFLTEEDRPGGRPAVVLAYDLWRTRFGTDPGLVGKVITLDGQPYTVVGIMPPGFRFPASSDFGTGTALWVPLQLPLTSRDPANFLVVIGRLRPEVSREQAAASLSILTKQLRKDFPHFVDMGQSTTVVPLQAKLVGNIRPALLVLMGAVGLVLLIACVNVANLMLSRSAGRNKEIAVRMALGAGRGRIFRQLTVESVLLGLVGGALGLLVAIGGENLVMALSPVGVPRFTEVNLDGRVLVFTLVISLLTGILFGIVPALSATRTKPNESLKEGSLHSTAGLQRRRFSGALVVGEVALSLILLAGAGLLVESFVKLANVNPGFDPRHVLSFETTLPESKYGTPPQLSAFYQQVLDRLKVLPGVEGAANVTNLPTQFGPDFPFTIEGHADSGGDDNVHDAQFRAISPDYFRVMRIPLLRGRYFSDRDTAGSPAVVVINERMAHEFWPNQDPLGQTIVIAKPMGPEWKDRPRQIVGVVGDVKDTSLAEPAPPEMFVPYTQMPAYWVALMVRVIPARWVLRTKGDPHSPATGAAKAVVAVDQNESIASVMTLEDVLSDSISRWRFNMFALGIFSAMAVILACVGIYGVLSYSVAQRTHELGIRIALGANRREVLKLVVGQGTILTLFGVGCGIIGALALTRLLSSQLYGVKPTDPLTYAMVTLILVSMALLACYLPARGATKVDPMVALRYE
jgi:putative ABC transport system permease protein